MRRSYEFKQEINHTTHETIGWGTYYPSSHEEYYHAPPSPPPPPPPPPYNMQKMLNHPTMPSTYHYDLSDDEDNHHQQVVVHDGRRGVHPHDDRDGNHDQYGVHHHEDEKKNNKHRGSILRPPLGYVGRNQSYPNLPPKVVDEVKNHTGYVTQHGPRIGVDQELGHKNGYTIASQHNNHHSPPNMPRYSDDNHNGYSIASQHKSHHSPPNMSRYNDENHNGYAIASQHKSHHSPPAPHMSRYSDENHNGYAIASQHKSHHSPPNMPPYSYENQNRYAIASQNQSPHQMPRYSSGEDSRIINNNHNLGDYSKRYPSYNESRYKDDDYYDHKRRIGDDYIESLIKGMNGMVKKIEVIEYERSTYRGGRQEWKVLGNGYPKSGAPWVK